LIVYVKRDHKVYAKLLNKDSENKSLR